MKALIINPADRSFELADIADKEQINNLIGFDTVIADDIDASGDQLYFDEECFLRGTEGRFKLDNLVPVSGRAVVIGSGADGALADMASDVETLKSRVEFIVKNTANSLPYYSQCRVSWVIPTCGKIA